MMKRRDMLTLAVSASAACAFLPEPACCNDEQPPQFPIVDTNISLFRWPSRRLPLDETETLVKKLRSLGIGQAWAGSFEGILARDIAGVNRRLSQACREFPELIPIGSVSPELPGWEDDLRRCVEEFNMPGIRLHPNYHGYTLDNPGVARILELAAAAGRFVQIAAAMEDTRTQNTLLQVSDVDLALLGKLIAAIPGARVQLLNHNLRPPLLQQLADTPGIYFDTARVEGTDGVPKLMNSVPAGRVMFGTHAPFLIPEAALIRVYESDGLDALELQAVLSENARQLLM